MKSKILIIGGGVVGVSIAHRLAQRNDPLTEPVVLLERGQIGGGPSGRFSAILSAAGFSEDVALLARESIRAYRRFEATSGRSIGAVRTGVLTLAGPDQKDEHELLEQNAALLERIGVSVELLDAGGIAERAAGIAVSPGSRALWEPEGGVLDPTATIEGLTSLARSYGAITRLGVEVTDLIIEGGAVRGVRTNEGEFTAEIVIVAAGPWSKKLLAPYGVDLPIELRFSETVFFEMTREELPDAGELIDSSRETMSFDIEEDPFELKASAEVAQTGHPAIVDLEHGFVCRGESALARAWVEPLPSRTKRIDSFEALTKEVSTKTRKWAHEVLAARLPEYTDRSEVGVQTGVRAGTADRHPIVGEIAGIQGLFVATAFGGYDYALAPGLGEVVAQLVMDEHVTLCDANALMLR
ncbi:MAG: FAD-binding oxidoreductase [Planctomycetota bacterium]